MIKQSDFLSYDNILPSRAYRFIKLFILCLYISENYLGLYENKKQQRKYLLQIVRY